MIKPPAKTPKAFAAQLTKLDSEPIVITGSRGKAVMLLLACITFVILGLVAIAKGEDDVLATGLPAALIFGLGVIVAIIQIARPSVMTISMEGVTVATILKTWSVRYDQVQDFFIYKTRAMGPSSGWTSSEMAAFNWIETPEPARRLLKIGRQGADGGFGPGWQLSARQLTDLLNAARARATQLESAR